MSKVREPYVKRLKTSYENLSKEEKLLFQEKTNLVPNVAKA